MGHGAAPHLPCPAAFTHFIYLGALQVVDLIGDPAQGRRGLDQQPGRLQHPVAGAVPTAQRCRQAKAFQGPALYLQALCAQGRQGAHGAGQVAHHYPGIRLIKALKVSINFIDPHRDLVAKRGGQRLLPVGPGDHRRVLMLQGEREQMPTNPPQTLQDQAPGIANLQDEPGVEDVLGGHAVMHVFTQPIGAQGLQCANGRHQDVPGFHALAPQCVEVEQLHTGHPGDFPRSFMGDDAHLRLGRR